MTWAILKNENFEVLIFAGPNQLLMEMWRVLRQRVEGRGLA
jgi:hypothetical protein